MSIRTAQPEFAWMTGVIISTGPVISLVCLRMKVVMLLTISVAHMLLRKRAIKHRTPHAIVNLSSSHGSYAAALKSTCVKCAAIVFNDHFLKSLWTLVLADLRGTKPNLGCKNLQFSTKAEEKIVVSGKCNMRSKANSLFMPKAIGVAPELDFGRRGSRSRMLRMGSRIFPTAFITQTHLHSDFSTSSAAIAILLSDSHSN